MKKNFSEWKKENIKDNHASRREFIGKTEEEYLTSKCILELMEHIADSAGGQGAPKHVLLLPEVAFFSKGLANRLSITPLQAVLLSLFVNFYPDSEIETKQLARHLECTNLAVMACYDDIKVLKDKKYISETKSRDTIQYYIPMSTITAFRENHDVIPMDYSNLSGDDLFNEIYNTFRANFECQIDYTEMQETLSAMVNSNQQLTFCRQINEYNLSKEDWILLVYACHLFYMNRSNTIEPDELRLLFPMRIGMKILRQFRQNNHPLLTQALLEPAGGVLASDNEWCLSLRAAKELMNELCPNLTTNAKRDVICADTIGTKALFYPNKTARQISELEDLLAPEKFVRVQESLLAHGMRKGFACLFYGSPGTGKTETVLQLARKTGRDIMQVDMSQMRDKFVGESEKNVKAIFTRYRRLCQESGITPILLLNEADALLSVRLEKMTTSVDQMANTMQNIILQEMENLEGILIATTNLTNNLDGAFDRRFLYKVEFQKPTAEESRHIWLAMLPALDDENARSLASKYDFSGGQIENIARKQVVSNILHDTEELDMSLIKTACDQERLNRPNGERIRITGFC